MSETKNGSEFFGDGRTEQTGNQNKFNKAQLNNSQTMSTNTDSRKGSEANPQIFSTPSPGPKAQGMSSKEPNRNVNSQNFSNINTSYTSGGPEVGRGDIPGPKSLEDFKQFSYGAFSSMPQLRYAFGIPETWGPNASKGMASKTPFPGPKVQGVSDVNSFSKYSGGVTDKGLNTGNGRNPGPLQSRGAFGAQFKSRGAYGAQKNKAISRRTVGPQVTYEEIGLFPRSFSRVFDRFFKQIFSDVENLVIQEYRFYRYLFLTTIKTLCILFFVPFAVNFIAKTYLIRPITEYFWNTQQTEIFLNSYEQKRAFAELEEFEEKLYFESLLESKNAIVSSPFLKASTYGSQLTRYSQNSIPEAPLESFISRGAQNQVSNSAELESTQRAVGPLTAPLGQLKNENIGNRNNSATILYGTEVQSYNIGSKTLPVNTYFSGSAFDVPGISKVGPSFAGAPSMEKDDGSPSQRAVGPLSILPKYGSVNATELGQTQQSQRAVGPLPGGSSQPFKERLLPESSYLTTWKGGREAPQVGSEAYPQTPTLPATLGSLQEKILELAIRYNNHSIEAITNFFADFFSLMTLLYLLVSLEIQINITKSFLLEVFFGLDDSKKSLLILIMTDLLVGYHSSNLWELFFQFIFNHYGIPESQTGIFLLVATLPVLLDVLFKYLIFRHLNRSSPATVATYHAIIE